MSQKPKTFKYISQKLLNSSIDYTSRVSFSHPHLLPTIDPNGPSLLYFEYCSLSLSQLIKQRKPNKLFIERDLLALMRGLTSALAYLQLNGVSHGNINPTRVFFDENTGVFKLYDEELLMGANRGFREAKAGSRSFLSPELIGYYRSSLNELRGNLFKADIFALGLTVIEAACLKPSEEVYEVGSLTIDMGKIEQRLMFIMKHYSREISHIIRMMVEIDEEIRPDATELYAILDCEFEENQPKETLATIMNKEIDLKKSWDSFETLYKHSGLRRINGSTEKKTKTLEEEKKKKEDVMVYRSKKTMADSCIFTTQNKENSPSIRGSLLNTRNTENI